MTDVKECFFDIPKVSNMQSANGNDIPNQFEIHTKEGVVFQSYASVIAFRPYDKSAGVEVYLDESKWDYSKTTGKYRNLFLGETKKETERKIKEGKYAFADLNS